MLVYWYLVLVSFACLLGHSVVVVVVMLNL